MGGGLLGQCCLEKESIYLTDIPQDYVNINSGLGSANPDVLFIVPLKINERVIGLLEMASFTLLQEVEKEFIEKVSESVASIISTVKINEVNKTLLEACQQ